MFLAQATEKLSKTLSKYSTLIKQEKLILSKREVECKMQECTKLISEINEALDIDPLEVLEKVESILEHIHRACVSIETSEQAMLPKQKTILLEGPQNRKFVLSVNIPRPQINFKDRASTHSAKTEDLPQNHTDNPEPALEEAQISAAQEKEDRRQALHLLHAEMSQKPIGRAEATSQIISTEEACVEANAEILRHRVVGVDIKTHRFRSYAGFTCYIQVSTPECVYLFDMLSLRNHSKLLTFLEAASVVKVMHKEQKKRAWLQKDLKYSVKYSVDVLNMAGLPEDGRKIGSAVKLVSEEPLKKQFHLIDWRYTPVSMEMHTELVDSVKHLLPIASFLCAKSMEQAFVDGYKHQVAQAEKKPTAEEFLISHGIEPDEPFVKIFLLRDFIAKQEDESPEFLITNRQLVTFIREKPRTPEQVFELFQNISPLFKANLNNFMNLLHAKSKQSAFNMTALKGQPSK
ncbi:exosome complex exonuclease RRP6 [Nematocida major]|uniref:exosome complex exonuclease RRP6 n=1 Tax=Nematocida major TaxID=1912982 RepID=UPI002007DC76|nr:exosome complex exonuclease RRP6 [Nematocida major]KAH9385169.1 exosome complex exonuclease RRP6 [Nematocida major]